jgi:hypothetical protein
VLRNIRRAAPDLTTTFTRLGPFADASRPGLKSLGKLSLVGKRALDATTQDVAELRRLSDKAPALAKPLRQFLQTIDDRKRAIEPDSRAAATAPPAPDKTAYRPGDGFTGMESLLNYFYWQTLAINGFDKVSHVLRFTVLVSGCSPYNTNPTPDQIKTCASWLGPFQPGITAPDPTAKGASAAKASAAKLSKLDPNLISDPKPQPERVSAPASAPATGTPQPASDSQPSAGQDPTTKLLDFLLGP